MTEKREERQRRLRHDRESGRRRPPRIETVYIFAVNGRPKPPEVRGDRFRLGDIVSTSDGPHKVVEVYWITEHKARVLLRLMPPEEKPKKDKKSKKFNTAGMKSSRRPAGPESTKR